jgi:galactose-1-phosphate uridylyltransferase
MNGAGSQPVTSHAEPRRITDLDTLVAALPDVDRARFERIFWRDILTGQLAPPEGMHTWLEGQFGSVDTVRHQRIVKITNRVTMEGALFNELRASQPIEAPAGSGDVEEMIHRSEGGPFCHPLNGTPTDMFGRVQGQFSLTASNVAKYDGWHSVIIFDEHHPLRFTAERVADYVDTAQRWAYAAHEADPQACYPFFLWNCLWRSGASILHGHAQMVLTRGMHYAKVESWRQAAVRYQAVHGADYFDDLLAVYHSLGLATDWGQATIFPTLTPFKEKETHIISRNLNADLKAALYLVLHTFVEQLGVQSFNLVLYQPPLAEVDEDWARFPCIIRLIDRGDPNNNRSDIGSMEMFAQSVVTTDPFRVADRLGATISRWRTL